MKTTSILREYIWIIETLRRDRLVSLKELSLRRQKEGIGDGQPLSRSTFTRYREAIRDIFGVEIACKRGTGFEYYIKNEGILSQDTVQAWIFSAFSIGHIVSDELRLHDRIILDNIPQYGEYLKTACEAMRSNLCLNICYQKYGQTVGKHYEIEPYCVKFFKQRWYLLGKYYVYEDPKDVFSTREVRLHLFCFDRIKSMIIGDRLFEMDPNFNAREYFKTSFGAFVDPTMMPEPVIIRAFGMARHYLQHCPLHETQHAIAETKDYTDFEVCLRPTIDFLHQVLSQGDCLKILEPSWVVDEMHALILDALQFYEPTPGESK